MGQLVTVNNDLLVRASNHGAFTKEQITILGLRFPLQSGWKDSVIGIKITQEQADLLVRLKGAKASRILSNPMVSSILPQRPPIIKPASKMRTQAEKKAKWRIKCDQKLEKMPMENRHCMINKHSQPTEFEIQSRLYTELNRLHHFTRGEIPVRGGSCKFDLVVYDRCGGKPICIIEVKRRRSSKQRMKKVASKREKQTDKYAKFGLPVLLIESDKNAKIYLDNVREKGTVLVRAGVTTWTDYLNPDQIFG